MLYYDFNPPWLILKCLRQRAASQRNDLFQGAPETSTRQRFTQPPHQLASSSNTSVSESPFNFQPSNATRDRENYSLNEHTALQEVETQLDNFLAQGQEILGNLVDQRTMLKGTHKRILDAANTLGLSRDVIGWIEKRR